MSKNKNTIDNQDYLNILIKLNKNQIPHKGRSPKTSVLVWEKLIYVFLN